MKNYATIDVHGTLVDAMLAIDKAGCGFVLVVDGENRLLGLLTDGDIRRHLLAGSNRMSSVASSMNQSPLVLKPKFSFKAASELFTRHKVRHIPVVDEQGRLVDVLDHMDYLPTAPRVDNPVVIMAGGMGTRLMPLTANCPKPMVKVAGVPMIERIIENLKSCGFYKVLLTVNYKKEVIQDYFSDGSDFGMDIKYIQEPKRMGTAGSLKLATEHLTQDFLVTNGDILCGVNFAHLLRQHQKSGAMGTMAVRDYSVRVPFGVVSIQDQKVRQIIEKPSYSYQVSAGINALSPKALSYIPEGRFYDMPSLFEALLAHQHETNVYHINEYWFDLGTPDDLDVAAQYIERQETI